MHVPKYRRHSTRDLGFVEYRGAREYFPGPYNSAESRAAYREFLRANLGAEPPRRSRTLLLADMVGLYLDHAKTYYPENLDGGGEYANLRYALLPLASHFPDLPAADFGPLKLKAWMDALAKKQQARGYVNQQANRIKRAFRWAVSEELIQPSVAQGLGTVQALAPGRTDAVEPAPKLPVGWPCVEAVLDRLAAPLSAALQVQWYTGVRSDSLVRATAEQFHDDGEMLLWLPHHKTEHRGTSLVIPIGPRCRDVLTPLLAGDAGEYLWSPRAVSRNRRYRERYTTHSYRQAIERATDRANAGRADKIPHWTPHQLRHARGQQVRELYGAEAAQAFLGHETLDATQIYTHRLVDLARRVALETG